MKFYCNTLNLRTQALTMGMALLVVLMLLGCGKEESRNIPPVTVPEPTPCTGAGCSPTTPSPTANGVPAPPLLATGETQELKIVNETAFFDYVGVRLNKYGPIHLNIQVSPHGAAPKVYLGSIRIRYYNDPGTGKLDLREGTFDNGTDTNKGNNVHVLLPEQGTSIPTYRMFFEDPASALILTLQEVTSGSDTTPKTLSGKLYFRNFDSTAPNPRYQGYFDPYTGTYFPSNPKAWCWSGIIKEGPYDCRNMDVQPRTSGGRSFTLLGTVTGLSKSKALGEN